MESLKKIVQAADLKDVDEIIMLIRENVNDVRFDSNPAAEVIFAAIAIAQSNYAIAEAIDNAAKVLSREISGMPH
ncbi:MAG: hypothetical protein Q8N63_02710 [Nanoarchaeota archaeon]|nr:hypothetical protein [Nanoarchaeota archaeon]